MGSLLLTFTAFIWGTSFVACVLGLEILSPHSFNAFRYLTTFLLILFFTTVRDFWNNRSSHAPVFPTAEWKAAIPGGVACGTMLFVASALQQMGLQYTEATKTAFITVLYIVIVPLCSVSFGRKIAPQVWLAVVMSVMGFYLLSISDGLNIKLADGLVFVGAFFWAFHILCCDHFVPWHNPLKLSCVQFITAFALSFLCAAMFENTPTLRQLSQAAVPVLFAGPLSMGVGFTLQMIAQKFTAPSVASLILSAESVFAALTGYIFLGEVLSSRELLGCAIIFAAIILSQIDIRFLQRRPHEQM